MGSEKQEYLKPHNTLQDWNFRTKVEMHLSTLTTLAAATIIFVIVFGEG